MDRAHLLAVARGDERADLLLKNGRLINVFSGEIHEASVAIAGSRIVGLGDGYQAKETLDLEGRYLSPGFIDAHVHIESSMLPPREFARVVLPRGVTTVVADPHEIANVRGLEGIHFMLREARQTSLSFFFNAPSCVPASYMETSGARLEATDLAPLLEEPEVLGLAEMMNFPGLLSGDPAVLAKLEAFEGRVIDGHCPRLTGRALNAYVGAGIGSDHECTGMEEAREKLRLGLTLFIREGTAARNLTTLLPLIRIENERRLCFCTDDRHCRDLLEEGSIDYLVRVAIERGVDPVTAIRMASLNAAEYFRLWDRGAVAPGRIADLLVFSDLTDLRAELVYREGRLVARDGVMCDRTPLPAVGEAGSTIHIDWQKVNFRVAAQATRMRVIGALESELVTDNLTMEPTVSAGNAVSDPERDLLKMAVIERHHGSGNLGLGFVQGIGLKRGAIAGTVAHDHHNLVVIGADDRSMLAAAHAVAEVGGGQVVVEDDRLLARVPLPIAGVMSGEPALAVSSQVAALQQSSHALGSALPDPFMTMSFLALEVIPSLKLTDRGLVDVDRFQIVPLFIEE